MFLIYGHMREVTKLFQICLKNFGQIYVKSSKIETTAKIIFHFFACLLVRVCFNYQNEILILNVLLICNYVCQILNTSISYIFDEQFANTFVILYAWVLYVIVLEKSFVINVQKLN